MILDASVIAGELVGLKFTQIKPPRDARMFVPTDGWLADFARYFLSIRKPQPRPERFDCDDHAIRAVDRATDALNDAEIQQDCGHTFGLAEVSIPLWTADYQVSSGLLGIPPTADPHMLNLVRTTTGWKFFEPQTGQFDDAKTLIDRRNVGARLWCWV